MRAHGRHDAATGDESVPAAADELVSCVRAMQRVMLAAHGAMSAGALHRVVGSNAWLAALETASDALARVDNKE